MAVEKKTRHERIYRLQRKLMAGVAALLVTIVGGASWWNITQNDSSSTASTSAQARAEFWQVIAGEKSPNTSSSAARLAVNLRDKLQNSPDDIGTFRAEASDYPGVVDKLGFNPFDNTGLSCTICGPLSPQMKNNLMEVRQGHVDQLVEHELSSVETPATLSVGAIIAWSALIYAGGSVASVMFAVRRDSRRNKYDASTVDWRSLGSSDDTYKTKSKALSLPYFIVVVPIKKALGKDFESTLKKTFLFDDERELTRLQNQVRSLPPGEEREALQSMLYQLRDGIDQQAETFRSKELEFQPNDANALSKSIAQQASDLRERLETRAQVYRELNPEMGYQGNRDSNNLHS